MLEIAHDRVGDAVHLELADMRALPRFGSFDLVWALGDVVNYLPHTADMERALRKMQLNLAPEGLLLFDLSTLLVFQTWFTGTEVVEHEGMRMIWTGQMTSDVSPGSLCTARLEVDEGPTRAEPHIHRMRHFSEAEVLDALAEAGLECLDVCGHHHDGVLKQPLSEAEHTKAIYIARAARPS
jgi:SAM-dependent methyltransferase